MKHYLLVAFSAAALLPSCNDSIPDQPLPEEEPSRASITTIVPDTSSTVTQAKATQIALNQLAPQGSRAAEKEILSVQTVVDSIGSPSMHIVNFAGQQGFVIVSATKDYFPVLAESDHGNFDLATLAPEHPVNLWLAEQKFRIANADSFDPELKASIASLWTGVDADRKEVLTPSRNGATGKPQVYYDSLARWSSDPKLQVYLYEDYIKTSEYASLSPMIKSEIQSMLLQTGNSNYGTIESSSIVLRRTVSDYFRNQLLKTEWGQGDPFNYLVPNRAPLDGTTIAAGQIMYYHKHPTTIFWGSLEDNGTSYSTQNFLFQLAKNIGVDFGNNDSEITNSDVKRCLQKYGYIVNEHDYDRYAVRSEVAKGFPVYMVGYETTFSDKEKNKEESHEWVCDGETHGNYGFEIRVMTIDYSPSSSIVPDLLVEAYKQYIQSSYIPLRFHYNWGWKGDCNGFYDDSNIKVTTNYGESHNFNQKRKTLYIHPNG